MVFKYWIFVTFRIACLRMNSLKARLSWPEWQIKNGEFIERSHACILNRGCFASRNFILISGRACLYRADESLNFHRPHQAATLTKRGKRKFFRVRVALSTGDEYFDVSGVSHDYLLRNAGNGRTRYPDASTATIAAAYRRNHYFFIPAAGRLLFRRWNKCRRIHSIIQTRGFFPADCRIMSQ